MELLCLSRWLVTWAREAAAVGSEANALLSLLNLVACHLFTHSLFTVMSAWSVRSQVPSQEPEICKFIGSCHVF